MCLLGGEKRDKVRGSNKDNPLKVNIFFKKTHEDFIIRILFERTYIMQISSLSQ